MFYVWPRSAHDHIHIWPFQTFDEAFKEAKEMLARKHYFPTTHDLNELARLIVKPL